MSFPRLKPFVVIGFAALLVLVLLSSPLWAMRFSHKVHEDNGITECTRCHEKDASDIIPEVSSCTPCHDEKFMADTPLGPAKTHTPLWVTQHGPDSQLSGAQCKKCHDFSFCVGCHQGGDLNTDLTKRTVRSNSVPRSHTSNFLVVHPLKATAVRINDCYTCHAKEFCSDCHSSYRSRFPGRKIISHQKSWELMIAGSGVPNHAGFTLAQCRDCHPGGALSSTEWSAGHAREARRSLKACQTCHPDGNACTDCHSAKSGLSISPHPKNWRSIQNKFRRESPQTCKKCHW
ncbi:MAG TPA: cytochrome C [Proteobacteria bacterium]|nr:doubled CXXCH motif [bacterium BMS3Abin14]HDL52435.1 cytochrome C [Pseudomonadota bacterium]